MDKSEKKNLLIFGKHAIREAFSRETGKISKLFVLNSLAPTKYEDLKKNVKFIIYRLARYQFRNWIGLVIKGIIKDS